ncbi:MAG: family 20 glycosylhydrolase, partial [Treponema sp.]|nr:family 20 glycosylhydrolase [Treponema sp.]
MSNYAIIPRPLSVEYLPGNFQCSGIPRIVDGAFQKEAAVFNGQIRAALGDEAFARDGGEIRLLKKDEPAAEESYCVEIRPDEICVSAAAETGIYRGLQTLRQLFLSERGNVSLPCGIIQDQPRFPWRGFMLDCSRNFYSAGFIKHLLDALSLQHINIFHWHLTDDQGWRLPVRQYPLLTEIGSMRKDRRRGQYIGGFYTEAEIRDIVSFAADRHIEVVPEIDLPGHTSAVLAAYPGLGCTGGP